MSGPARTVDVVIVGAGMSGICMAVTLVRAGIRSFTIVEKASDLGGTWRDNRYPGLTCDVPAPFYSYSFAPNAAWRHRFATGAEIHRYLRTVFDRYELGAHTRFDTEVVEARFDGRRWRLDYGGGVLEADVVVAATGVLHRPRLPVIAGLDTFGGPSFHSARWDDDARVDGTRVGVVGTGSTGAQIVTALSKRAAHVTQFQRTAQWVLPLPNQRYSKPMRVALTRAPQLSGVLRRAHQQAFEIAAGGLTKPGVRRKILQGLAKANLRAVRDRSLRATLTPDYEPGCKRMVISAGYYRAVQRRNVEVVTAPIRTAEGRGVVTTDGVLHELDVLVLATGFEALAYLRPMRVLGPDGESLEHAWRDGPRAHLTLSVPGLPNLFLLMGPNSPIGNTSLVPVAEIQAAFVARVVTQMANEQFRTIEARHDATERFVADIAERLDDSVWVTGCDSWYLRPDGTPNLWPGTLAGFGRELARHRDDDWIVTR